MRRNQARKVKKKKISRWIAVAVIVAILASGVAMNRVRANRAAAAAIDSLGTITLSKTDIANSISVSGQVDSSNTADIYSSLSNYPVLEILVETGDRVVRGAVLARIDTTNLEYDIEQAKNNLESARLSLETERQNNQNSIINAQNTLNSAIVSYDRQQLAYEKSLDDLREAEEDAAEPFDTYTYDNAIANAKAALENRQADLEKAINDRKTAGSYFDGSAYYLAISTAQTKVTRCQQDYDAAQAAAALIDPDPAAIAADPAVVAAKRLLEDAQAALDKAYNDLYRAQSDFDSANQSALDAADAKVNSAKTAVEDAQRAYDTAVTDLQRAVDKAAEDSAQQLLTAQRNAADAERALEAARLNVTSAQNSLNQARNKIITGETNVANQQLTLERLLDQLAKSEITASANGTVTAVNAAVGVNPTGVLFTIEDTDLLYVSALVKEYNLKDLSIGQAVLITTDATGKEVFEGDIIYISPRAVSAAGSTNVEFEIWAAIKKPDKNIKIGMNAFLEIVIASKEDVFAVPLSAIVTNEQGSFVRTRFDGESVDIPVEIGLRTSTSAEISGEGIVDGLVILSEPNAVPDQRQQAMGFRQ